MMKATKLPQKLMLLGSGELGKEFVIAAQRLGPLRQCPSHAGC
jgi:phosphoribosylglycinamide formyltransferase 2